MTNEHAFGRLCRRITLAAIEQHHREMSHERFRALQRLLRRHERPTGATVH
jgi:hypothetical protein